MKMNIKVLILTGILTATAVAYDPCPGRRHQTLCCTDFYFEVDAIKCHETIGPFQNLTEYEETCEEDGTYIPVCCRLYAPDIGEDCTKPV
ncbi:hypothetical protein J3E69DRAFT_332186 [Trichoderma sp. SZMC 28015]